MRVSGVDSSMRERNLPLSRNILLSDLNLIDLIDLIDLEGGIRGKALVIEK
jgi:hypothetical protein